MTCTTLKTARSLMLATAILSIAATAKAADPATPTATFSQVNQNIFQSSCVSCHTGSASPAGIDLSSFTGVSSHVQAGSPQQSKIYQVISDGKMPPTGALPQDKIQLLSEWITDGAKNN